MIFKPVSITIILVLFAIAVAVSGCTTTTPTATPTTTPTTAPVSSAVATPPIGATATVQASATPTTSATIDSAPKTYTGTGAKTLGPISLIAGSTTFSIKCSDAGNSGFIVSLQDTPGNNVNGVGVYNSGTLYTNVAGTQITNNIDVTKTYTLPAAGNYYIDVSCNGVANWEVSVTQ